MQTQTKYTFLSLLLLVLFACGKSKEEKINDAFLQDSLQYEETKRLQKTNQEILEIDTAMNNPNSKDPALPVMNDKE